MITIDHLTKSFPGVTALDDVAFTIQSGSVHGLVGENGAGKSTLIKILSGIYQPDMGSVLIDGQPAVIASVHDAQGKGIATIFQELTIVPELSVAENISLGREPVKAAGFIDWGEMHRKSREALDSLEAPIDPRAKVGSLSVANQQIVEICKAMMLNARTIIMDEPTSSLTEHEVRQLFGLIGKLKQRGITILYVSHKIEEIFEICDYITVFRDGQHIATVEKTATRPAEVISMMVGRSMDTMFPPRTASPGEVLLSVRNLTRKGEFSSVSFDLRRGEIIGFAGLIGAGRTELAKAIFGITVPDSGEIYLEDRPLGFVGHPAGALSRGVAYLPEERKREGLVLMLSVKENMSLSILKRISRRLLIDRKREAELADRFIDNLKVKVTSRDALVESLSGGNQQKVVISKLLLTESDVLIFDEPTRGIDVGAKHEIYQIMNDLTEQGKGIIFISSELPEVLGISDRILCMREGELVREYTRKEARPEGVMHVLTGGSDQ
ncbi:MAG: sugar ABC transporter ATP-binding protein [Spirochaetales bacterium]|nr:sugar ABC transporter ATP-binding protein [Spirochaetales bacterium]